MIRSMLREFGRSWIAVGLRHRCSADDSSTPSPLAWMISVPVVRTVEADDLSQRTASSNSLSLSMFTAGPSRTLSNHTGNEVVQNTSVRPARRSGP